MLTKLFILARNDCVASPYPTRSAYVLCIEITLATYRAAVRQRASIPYKCRMCSVAASDVANNVDEEVSEAGVAEHVAEASAEDAVGDVSDRSFVIDAPFAADGIVADEDDVAVDTGNQQQLASDKSTVEDDDITFHIVAGGTS